MKRVKKLKMFILAVGLACGVQLVNVSAMQPEQPNNSLSNTEDYDAYGGELPYFYGRLMDLIKERQKTKDKLKQFVNNYNEEREKLEKLKDLNTKRKNEYLSGSDDPTDKEIVKLMEKEFLIKARPIVVRLEEYEREAGACRVKEKRYNKQIDDIGYNKVSKLEQMEEKKEMEFDNLMIKIFEKRGKLIELKKRKYILEQKYLKEKNDLKQSGTDNTDALSKRANCFEELKKLEKINKDYKELENEIKEEDKKLIQLGAELNRIDQKRGRIDHKRWIRPLAKDFTLNDNSDNKREISIIWKDILDMRKNGTSKHWENYLDKAKQDGKVKKLEIIAEKNDSKINDLERIEEEAVGLSNESYGGEIPRLNDILSLKEARKKRVLYELDRLKYKRSKDIENFDKSQYKINDEVNKLSLNDPFKRTRGKVLQKENLKNKAQLNNRLQGYNKQEYKLRTEVTKYNKEINQLDDKLHDLKKIEYKKNCKFRELIEEILSKNNDLIKLKRKRDFQNQRYYKALQDLDQSNNENVMVKRSKYLKEMKEFKKLDGDCKKLQNEIKEKDDNLKKLGTELNVLDDKTSKGSKKNTILCYEDEDYKISLDFNDMLDIRKNGTSKYLENFELKYRVMEDNDSDV